MTGFTNTTNLQSENMRLHNNLLEKYPIIADNLLNMENRFKAIENNIEDSNLNQKSLNQYILQSAYNNDSRPMISQTGIRDGAYIEELHSENDFDDDDNNADVVETGGSDTF